RRLSDPDLRIKDQDRDGVQAEVLYGILGATGRMNDPDATVEVMRIYNEWLADFCSTHPERYAGLASIPNNPLEAAITEIERVAKRGALRGLDIANSPDLKPLWDPYWNPLWEVVNASGLPLHFHTVGGYVPDHIRKIVFVGSDPSRATLPPSEYWKRQCWATYQTDPIGIKLLDELGADRIMWGSDFPHPDGVWPDSREYVQREMGHLPADVRRKIVCENAARLYGFELG